jgi:hypothetical protein
VILIYLDRFDIMENKVWLICLIKYFLG